VCHRATALPGVAPSDLSIVNCGAPPKRRAAFALRRAVGQVRGRYRYQLGEVPHDEAHWWHVCLFRTAVVTDASQQGMRVRSLDRAKLLTLAHQGAGTMLRLLRTGTRVKARYRKEFPVHCGRENWTRLYGLE
jgi:galactofuranosylgalactofuranosylrhamnosyl-N-acetylglucosaminyl-diphospho-decaprenol beta-1,5/1,6-galactofuranosyltransferase